MLEEISKHIFNPGKDIIEEYFYSEYGEKQIIIDDLEQSINASIRFE